MRIWADRRLSQTRNEHWVCAESLRRACGPGKDPEDRIRRYHFEDRVLIRRWDPCNTPLLRRTLVKLSKGVKGHLPPAVRNPCVA